MHGPKGRENRRGKRMANNVKHVMAHDDRAVAVKCDTMRPGESTGPFPPPSANQ